MIQKRTLTPDPNKRCWLIADLRSQTPNLAAQFAHLRGFEVQAGSAAQRFLQAAKPESSSFIASSFAILNQMTVHDRESLHTLVNAGATLFIRGEVQDGSRYQLNPLIDASFTVANAADAVASSFRCTGLIPAVLRDEKTPHRAALNCAFDL